MLGASERICTIKSKNDSRQAMDIQLLISAASVVSFPLSIVALVYARRQAKAADAANELALRGERRRVYDSIRSLQVMFEQNELQGSRIPPSLRDDLTVTLHEAQFCFGPDIENRLSALIAACVDIESDHDKIDFGSVSTPTAAGAIVLVVAEKERCLGKELAALVDLVKPQVRKGFA